MSTNLQLQAPFLRAQRNFPVDSQPLSVEINKSYVDIANAVNVRTIGLFPFNKSIINGEIWLLAGRNEKQQGIRQAYTFTSAGNIAHGLNLGNIAFFVRIFGTFTDGTNYYPLPYVDATAANNQVAVKVTPTNIVITAGGGSPPTITNGVVVLEWLSNV
jgi:hypothetical protein